ncbi:universal stress protein [Streptomyces sp. NPDC052682]|uniref:universal stress protein n=1 Tax=Streptomyces sp. NPDC052682 TaxID=3154954 RepID=UPI003440BA9A
MRLPLVVGVDGSEPSLLAVDWAADEAARRGLPLRLVYASLWERYEGPDPSGELPHRHGELLAQGIVERAAERAVKRRPEVDVSVGVVAEDAATALLREGHNAAALVTGSRGRGELKGLLLGSVGLLVAARAHGPVIVVRGDRAGLAGTHERILLGAGEPSTGADAVRFAFFEAETRGCVLDVVRAWRRPAYDSAGPTRLAGDPARRHEERAGAVLDTLLEDVVAEYPGVRVRRVTVEGPARRVLLSRSAAADLVIVGARRRSGHRNLQLGRVGYTLLHHAACPVVIVPQRV